MRSWIGYYILIFYYRSDLDIAPERNRESPPRRSAGARAALALRGSIRATGADRRATVTSLDDDRRKTDFPPDRSGSMEKTPSGTSVGVTDPYAFAGRCDHVTSDGRCRFAFDHAASDPTFARERRREEYRCPVVENGPSHSSSVVGDATGPDHGDRDSSEAWTWRDCSHYRSRTRGHECVRCGLEERRIVGSERPLLDEHHLSYADSSSPVDESRPEERINGSGTEAEARSEPSHEITVSLCRWCHAKVHDSWARIDDDASPATEAIAAREGRLTREHTESAFETAAKRRSRK